MSQNRELDRLLTVEEVAAHVGVTEETVRRWLRGGELRGLRFSRKMGWRIREADLRTFLDRRWNVPAEDAVPHE